MLGTIAAGFGEKLRKVASCKFDSRLGGAEQEPGQHHCWLPSAERYCPVNLKHSC